MDLDIAVIGGGVSGAYGAWRLQQHDPKAKIALFEYSDRIGGRLFTVTPPGLPHVKAGRVRVVRISGLSFGEAPASPGAA